LSTLFFQSTSSQVTLFADLILYEVGMGKDRLDFPDPPTELDELPDRALVMELNTVLLKERTCRMEYLRALFEPAAARRPGL
jgi:hypothetical protein